MIQFLLGTGLVTESLGLYKIGKQSTHIEPGSPHLLKHHSNWRLKALQKNESLSDDELIYSAQFSLSRKDFETLQEQITEFLKPANGRVRDSEPEGIAGLNIH